MMQPHQLTPGATTRMYIAHNCAIRRANSTNTSIKHLVIDIDRMQAFARSCADVISIDESANKTSSL